MPCDEQGTPAHFVLDQKTNCSSRPAFSRAQSGVCDEGTHLCLRTFTVVQRTPSPTPAPPGPQSQLEQLAERPSRPVRAAVRATPPSSPQTTNEGGMGCAGHFLGLWGSISAPGARWASFVDHSPPVPVFAPPHQTIWSTFLQCLSIWPIFCTQFMMMERVGAGSGGSDILCC